MEWSIILTILLTASCVSPEEAEGGFTVTTFASNPGIFYEEIGTLSEAKATWRLAVTMDLAALSKRESDVSANLQLLLDICEKQGRDDPLCPAIADSVARMVRKIEDGMGTVHDLVKPDSASKRIKSITGNMDAADAERIHQEITAIRSNQRTLKESMKDQLQVVESTLHLFNFDTFTNVQSNELALQELIAHVNLTLTADLSTVMKEQRLEEGLTALSVIVEALQKDAKELVSLLGQIASSKVSAAVLPPRKLEGYLTDALPYLPTGTGFPVPIERNEASTLMRLADIKAFSQGNAIVVILDFPLISEKRYSVSKVYPIPVRSENGAYYCLDTSEDLVIVDQENRNFLRMTSLELKNCKQFANRYICNPLHPSIPLTSSAPCEVLTFAKMDTGNGLHCPKRVITFDHILVITMHQPGKWLFVAPTDVPITITCDGNPASHETLRHVGLLALVGVCTVTAQNFSLRTIRRITQVPNEDYLPPFNLTLLGMDQVVLPRVTSDIGKVKLVKELRNPEEFARPGMQVSSIKASLDRDDQHLEQYYHNLGFYSLGTIAPIALVCFAVYKCYKRKHNSTSTTPALTPNSVSPVVNIQLEPLVSRPDNFRAALNIARERRFRWAVQNPQDRTNATGRHPG